MCMYCDILSNAIKFAFVAIVSDFLFVISVQKTILMKIIVLCATNSSRHGKCFVRG